MPVAVEAPRANANEDQLRVMSVHVVAGQAVAAGDLLFVLETTKAAVEVEAPAAGVVSEVRVEADQYVTVGDMLCSLDGDMPREVGREAAPVAVAAPSAPKITAKARALARKLDIDPGRVAPVGGRIGEAEILAAAPERSRLAADSRTAIIMGGGGHAACLIHALRASGYELLGCLDDSLPIGSHVTAGVAVIGTQERLAALRTAGTATAFVGIGGGEDSRLRTRFFHALLALGYDIPAIIDPDAIVASGVRIGRGCHVLAGSIIGARCVIGSNVIVNQGSNLCHDSIVHDDVHLTPGAIVAGGVTIGRGTVVGMGSTILYGAKVGANCLIHNGAHVTSDVGDDVIVTRSGQRLARA